jgi:hypothetical protein
MLVKSIEVSVAEGAYDIAANYLKATGRMSYDVDFHRPLFDSIVNDFRTGRRNKLLLANRAIARIEKADDMPELIS